MIGRIRQALPEQQGDGRESGRDDGGAGAGLSGVCDAHVLEADLGQHDFCIDDNTQKRRDFQSEVVRVFYMPNAGTVQEFQEIANALRTVAEIRRVFHV